MITRITSEVPIQKGEGVLLGCCIEPSIFQASGRGPELEDDFYYAQGVKKGFMNIHIHIKYGQ